MPNEAIVDRLRTGLERLGAQMIVSGGDLTFRDPLLAEAYKLWQEKAGDAGLPRRQDLSPKAMNRFLSRVAIFERVEGPDQQIGFRARLTGPELAAAYTEMSGKFIDDSVPKKYLPRWNLLLGCILEYGAPIRMIGIPQAFSKDHSVVEFMFAPMLDNYDRVSMVLAVVKYLRGQLWSTIEPEERARLAARAAA